MKPSKSISKRNRISVAALILTPFMALAAPPQQKSTSEMPADLKQAFENARYAVESDGSGAHRADNPANHFAVQFAGEKTVTVKEIVAVNGAVSANSNVLTVGSGFTGGPNGVAVDSRGNVFVTEYSTSLVKEIVAANGAVSANSSIVIVGSGFLNPSGVAVDGGGNVFVADSGSDAVKEIVAVNGTVSANSTVVPVGSGFSQPTGVAVDGSGDVFAVDIGNNVLKEIVAVNGTVSANSAVISVASALSYSVGVALDGTGNIFVADFGSFAVNEIDRSDPPSLTFANTNVGGSSAAQSLTIQNTGNDQLTFTALTVSSNFAQTAGGGTPADCNTSTVLAPGESCNLRLVFAPSSSGPLTGAVNLTYNLNGSPATQTIPLSGTGAQATVNVTVSTNIPGLSITVDGTPYSSPQNFSWTLGSSHNIATAPTQPGAAGTQYVFTGWSDGSTSNHSVTVTVGTTSYIASFKTQFLLMVLANPTAGGTVSAGGYFDAASSQTVQATSNNGYVFSNWTGPVVNPNSTQSSVVMTAPLTVTANFTPTTTTVAASFLAGAPSGNLRNDFSGYVGMKLTVGTTPLSVSQLGRWVVAGNSGTHIVKLVKADGTDLASGSVSLSLSGVTAGQYAYVSLPSAVTLAANTSYYLVTQEFAGGDRWYDGGPVTPNASAGVVNSAVYQPSSGPYVTAYPGSNSYVTPNFLFVPVGGVPFLSSTPSSAETLRNDYTGYVGLQFTVGNTPLVVSQLGRWTVAGNSGAHIVKLVQANGTDVPGGMVNVNMAGATAGQYTYASLASPVNLLANATYYLVTQEFAGGDQWYDYSPVTASSGTVNAPAYQPPNGVYVDLFNGSSSYGPPNFLYFGGNTSTPPPTNSLVSSAPMSNPRSDYSGFVGLEFTVGSAPIQVSQLGRWGVAGNASAHTVKLVDAVSGADVAAVTVTPTVAGQFNYAALGSPVTLAANHAYYLVTQEIFGGDQWYDYGPVTPSGAVRVNGPAYQLSSGAYTLLFEGADSYGTVSLMFGF